MSVDYESVLIYGYKIPEDEVQRLVEDIGIDAWIAAKEKYDSSEHYTLLSDSCYYESDYYFGVKLGSGLVLDELDALCWFEYETAKIDEEFERVFGSMTYADTHTPMMYHFTRAL